MQLCVICGVLWRMLTPAAMLQTLRSKLYACIMYKCIIPSAGLTPPFPLPRGGLVSYRERERDLYWQPIIQREREREREIFIDNLLVRVHWIIEMIVVERPCAMGV